MLQALKKRNLPNGSAGHTIVFLLKANLRAFLCQNYGVAPCENPFCPGENLHTLRSLQSIAEFSMPNGKYLTENIKRGYPVEWVFIEH
jgi:hypothetical protein